jgi:uncharacterized protein (TIGR02246 family)
MTRIALAIPAAFALFAWSAQAAAPETEPLALSTGDEKAVRALVDAFAGSWNRHDMKAMHDLDTDDVEWINVVGHDWRGKDTVYRGHLAFHQGLARKSVMSVESAHIRSIAPDVAVAVATMHFSPLVAPDGQEVGPAAKTRGSFVAVKRNAVWRIVHFHNTVIDPQLENSDLPGQAVLPPGGTPK